MFRADIKGVKLRTFLLTYFSHMENSICTLAKIPLLLTIIPEEPAENHNKALPHVGLLIIRLYTLYIPACKASAQAQEGEREREGGHV